MIHQELRLGELGIAHGQLPLAAEKPAQRGECNPIEFTRADGARDFRQLADEARQVPRCLRNAFGIRRGREQTGRRWQMKWQVPVFELCHRTPDGLETRQSTG